MKDFLKEKLFQVILVILSLVLAVIKYAAHGSATDMWLWLAISALNLAALVRDYRKMKS